MRAQTETISFFVLFHDQFITNIYYYFMLINFLFQLIKLL